MRRLLLVTVLLACLLAVFTSPAVAAWSFVQKAANSSTGVINVSVTVPSTTAGNFLAIQYSATGNDIGTPTVSDGGTNTYTQSWIQANGSSAAAGLFFVKSLAGGTITVTVTSGTAGAANWFVSAAEFSGGDTTSPASGTPVTNSGVSTTATTGSMTPSNNDVLVLAMMSEGTIAAVTENQGGQGFTLLNEDEGGSSGAVGSAVYKIITGAPSSQSESWSNGFGEFSAGIAAFKSAAGGGGDTTPPTTPASIAIGGVTSESETATWAASTDNVAVTGYNLQRCAGAGCSNFAGIATTPSTNFQDTGLTPSTSYTYRVRAFDAAGNFSGFATSSQTSTLASGVNGLTWVRQPPFTEDGFAIYRCVTTAASCTPSTNIVYTTSGPGTTSLTDSAAGRPISCYQIRATLAGTPGSGLSNIACSILSPFTLTVLTAGSGTGTATPSGTNNFTSGAVVGLTATPGVTSDFSGWSGDPDCTDGSVTMNASKTCTATFIPQTGTFAYLGNRGSQAVKTLSNTIGVQPSSTISQTNLLIVRAVTDNTSTTSGQTAEHTSVTDTTGNQYVKLGEVTRSGGAAGSGVTTSLWASRPFASLTTASTVTLTTATARVANAITLEEFSLAANTTFATNPISNNTSTGNSTTPSAVLTGLSNVFRLYLANLGVEGPIGETFTQGVNYASGTTTNGTSGGATTSNVTSRFGFRRQTATTDSFAPTISPAENWGLVYVSLATATAQNASSVTLTNSGTGGGTVTGAATYYNGTNVTITATPNNQSQFVAWQNVAGDNCASTTNNTVVIQLTQNTTCNAVFTLATPPPPTNFNLTIATTGTGTGTTSPPVGVSVVASGTVVNLVATPASNSTFGGWSPAICAPGSFTMSADTTCTATFTLRPLATMTTVNAGTGQGTTTGAGTFFAGDTAVLTATPAAGSFFSGWSGSPGCVGTASPLSVLMDASKTCTATYTVQTGGAPTGVLSPGPGKRCSIYYVASLSSGGPISTLIWQINGVTKRSSDPGVPIVQTTAPFTFRQSLVSDGSTVTAVVTDTSQQTGIFGPALVSCP